MAPLMFEAVLIISSASDDPIDVMVGDWMSEKNMPTRAFGLFDGSDPGKFHPNSS